MLHYLSAILTKHRIKSNALVRVSYGHVELHQFCIACSTVTVQLGISWVPFDSFSVELDRCWIITCQETAKHHSTASQADSRSRRNEMNQRLISRQQHDTSSCTSQLSHIHCNFLALFAHHCLKWVNKHGYVCRSTYNKSHYCFRT